MLAPAAGTTCQRRTAHELEQLIRKEPAKVQEKNLFDMQAKNMQTELQTTEGSAIKIIHFHSKIDLAGFFP